MEGHDDFTTEIFKALQECSSSLMRSANLRALINSGSVDTIFVTMGTQILQWLNENSTGLGAEEELRLRAMIMKVHGNQRWYDQDNEGEYF